MPKKAEIPSVYDIKPFLKQENLLPVYFIAGTDLFTVDNVIKVIAKAVEPLLSSDFDKETISVDNAKDINPVLDIAYAYPFGSEKKLVIVRGFEKYNTNSIKKQLMSYLDNPAEFTVLVLVYGQAVKHPLTEIFKKLFDKGFIFEARQLSGKELRNWMIKEAARLGMKLSDENAEIITEITGEDKSLIEMNLRKFSDYLVEGDELNLDVIKKLSSATKEYDIFDLQDALGQGDEAKALETAYNLIENGKELPFINVMLHKYFSTIIRLFELRDMNKFAAAKELKISIRYYEGCRQARYFQNEMRLKKAFKALFETDLAVKSTPIENKTAVTLLIKKMFL